MRLVYPYPTALRYAALLAVLRMVSIAAASVTGVAALSFDRSLLLPALILIGTSLALILVSYAQSFSLKCVVCRCALFLPKTCAKSPKAKSFLGSRILEMSMDILLGTSFRCMYCGERCGCKKSSRKHGSRRATKGHGSSRAATTLVLGRNPAAPHSRQLPVATRVPQFNLMSSPTPPRTQPAPRSPYPAPPAQQFPPSLLPQATPFGSPLQAAHAGHNLWPAPARLA